MRVHERKNKTLQVLNQIVEHTQAFWIIALKNLVDSSNLCGAERYMLIA